MDFETFANRIREEIKDHLPDGFQDAEFVIKDHEKLNEKYTGLTIANRTVAPVANLDNYYWDYTHGRSFANIMGAIAESIEMAQPEIDFDVLRHFDKAKEHLFIRVSNAEKNQEFLKTVPHTIVEDLAITYHLRMNVDENGISSSVLTNDSLKMYGVSKKELHEEALTNSEKLFPADIFDLHEHMRQSFISDMKMEGRSDEEIEALLQEFPNPGENVLTMVTNDVKVNGAAVLFYPGLMDEIAKRTEGDYFILPSSVHETLILPDDGAMNYKELMMMVSDINQSQVIPEERLSDQVYHYDPIDRVFEKASSFEERLAQKAEAERNAKKQSIMDKLGEKKEDAKAMFGDKKITIRTAEVSL